MKLYVYLDETEFPRGKSNFIGCGFFYLDNPIPDIVIKEALEYLKNDPDIYHDVFKAKDTKTIKRGFFHASEDSKNAHSHICRSIVKNMRGNFEYCYYNPKKQKSLTKYKKIEDIQNYTIQLATITISNLISNEVIFTIEKRSTFRDIHLKTWVEQLYKYKERNIYDYPSIPSLFPKIQMKIGEKSEYGLQVTDFILWAVNRSKMKPAKSDWFNRLNLEHRQSFIEKEGPLQGGSYFINREITTPFVKYPRAALPSKDNSSNSTIINSYVLIEHILKIIQEHPLPSHVEHLKDNLNSTVEKLSNKNLSFSNELVQKAASIFLRLFDTLPIYKDFSDNDIDKWASILIARKIASLILRIDLPHGVATMDYVTKSRRDIIKTDFNLLEVREN